MSKQSLILSSAPVSDQDILTKIKNVDGQGSLLDADTLDGKDASEFADTIGTPKLIFYGVQSAMPIGTVVPTGLSFLDILGLYNPLNLDISNKYALLPNPTDKYYVVEFIPGARTGWPSVFNRLSWVKTTNGTHNETFEDNRPVRESFSFGLPDTSVSLTEPTNRPIVGFRVNNTTGADIVLDGTSNAKKYWNIGRHNLGNQPKVLVWQIQTWR